MASHVLSIAAAGEENTTFDNSDEAETAALRQLLGRYTLDNGMAPFGDVDVATILREIEALTSNLGSAFMPDPSGNAPLDAVNPALIARSFNAVARLAALALIYTDAR
jgi:hypothetical protein